MKVGVTGASGYVGKKVVKELQQNNHEVFRVCKTVCKK
ncbi:MAG: NAD-dependent epimerase/dehydratase family protein [Candidatus Actinomarina sp.]